MGIVCLVADAVLVAACHVETIESVFPAMITAVVVKVAVDLYGIVVVVLCINNSTGTVSGDAVSET